MKMKWKKCIQNSCQSSKGSENKQANSSVKPVFPSVSQLLILRYRPASVHGAEVRRLVRMRLSKASPFQNKFGGTVAFFFFFAL